METFVKIFFGFAVFVFCLIVIGVFLIILKFALMFVPQIDIMGITIS
jgi:hypothetical protein